MKRKITDEQLSLGAAQEPLVPANTEPEDSTTSGNVVRLRPKKRNSYGGRLPVRSESLKSLGLTVFPDPQSPEDDPPPGATPCAAKKPRGKLGKKKIDIPENLLRIPIQLDTDEICGCGRKFRVIKCNPTEKIGIIPAKVVVEVNYPIVQECKKCVTLKRVRVRNGVTHGWKYSTSFLVETIVRRFAEYIPYHRQSLINMHSGMHTHRSTLSSQVIQTILDIEPVFDALNAKVISSKVLMLDETALQLLGADQLAWCWSVMSDNRRHDPGDHPAVVLHFALSRKKEVILDIMKHSNCEVAVADGYSAYVSLTKPDRHHRPVKLANCNAHARRRFYDVVDKDEDPSELAAEIMILYASVYRIERQLRDLPPDQRVIGRRHSSILMDKMRDMMSENQGFSKKSPIGEAVRYFLNHFEGLTVFLNDGRVEIDNNLIENQMRPIATLRNACRFTASELGGKHG